MHRTAFTAAVDAPEPVAAVAAALASAGFAVSPPVAATRTMLDTFDGRLHAAGLRLVATGPGSPELLLESTASHPPARLSSATVPRWPSDLPPGPLRSRLAAACRERALLPVVTTTTALRQATKQDRRGKVVARVEIHGDMSLGAPGGQAAGDAIGPVDGPPWIAEVVPVAGHGEDADRAMAALAGLGAVADPDGLWGVAAVRTGRSLEGFRSSPSVAMAPGDDALDTYRRVFANLAATIAANRPGVIDDLDPEFLHELRVAVRRTRSILGAARDVVPAAVRDEFREAFRWLGAVTTPARDLDVFLLGWDEVTAPLGVDAGQLDPVRVELQARRAVTHDQLVGDLRSERFADLLDRWQRWLEAPGAPATAHPAVGPVVARRVRRRHAALVRDGRAISEESPGERLHELRKEAKKLRYLLECFGPLYPARPRKVFVGHLKALQDNLGAHQDAEVHLGQLAGLAHDLHAAGRLDPGAAIATGRLVEHLHDLRLAERRRFAGQYAGFDTRKADRSLRRMLERLVEA